MEHHFDLVVIGAGPGGYAAAVKAAESGMKTAVVEQEELGGTCLNRGCIPTKTLLHTAELYQEILACRRLGIEVEGVHLNPAQMQSRKEAVLEQLRSGIAGLFKKHKVTLFKGQGHVCQKREVQVSQADGSVQLLEADHILIAAGSKPAMLPIPGIDLPGIMSSDELLSYQGEKLERLLIVGGGVIGMEFASLYQALGTQVTVVESLDRILGSLDRELAQSLKMISGKRGINIITGAQIQEFRKKEGALCCRYLVKGEMQEAEADAVLVAVGRRPCTEGLFAEEAKPIQDQGRILVDVHYRTDIPGIYAIGDVTGGYQLAHTASAQGINAVCAMAGREPEMNLDVVPACVYTNPEIASVGLNQDEAKHRGLDVVVGKYLTSANGKSVLSGQERGYVKVVAERQSGKVVGAQLMCARATDMVGEFALAIARELTLRDIIQVIHPHPTFSEGIAEAAQAAWDKIIR